MNFDENPLTGEIGSSRSRNMDDNFAVEDDMEKFEDDGDVIEGTVETVENDEAEAVNGELLTADEEDASPNQESAIFIGAGEGDDDADVEENVSDRFGRVDAASALPGWPFNPKLNFRDENLPEAARDKIQALIDRIDLNNDATLDQLDEDFYAAFEQVCENGLSFSKEDADKARALMDEIQKVMESVDPGKMASRVSDEMRRSDQQYQQNEQGIDGLKNQIAEVAQETAEGVLGYFRKWQQDRQIKAYEANIRKQEESAKAGRQAILNEINEEANNFIDAYPIAISKVEAMAGKLDAHLEGLKGIDDEVRKIRDDQIRVYNEFTYYVAALEEISQRVDEKVAQVNEQLEDSQDERLSGALSHFDNMSARVTTSLREANSSMSSIMNDAIELDQDKKLHGRIVAKIRNVKHRAIPVWKGVLRKSKPRILMLISMRSVEAANDITEKLMDGSRKVSDALEYSLEAAEERDTIDASTIMENSQAVIERQVRRAGRNKALRDYNEQVSTALEDGRKAAQTGDTEALENIKQNLEELDKLKANRALGSDAAKAKAALGDAQSGSKSQPANEDSQPEQPKGKTRSAQPGVKAKQAKPAAKAAPRKKKAPAAKTAAPQ